MNRFGQVHQAIGNSVLTFEQIRKMFPLYDADMLHSYLKVLTEHGCTKEEYKRKRGFTIQNAWHYRNIQPTSPIFEMDETLVLKCKDKLVERLADGSGLEERVTVVIFASVPLEHRGLPIPQLEEMYPSKQYSEGTGVWRSEDGKLNFEGLSYGAAHTAMLKTKELGADIKVIKSYYPFHWYPCFAADMPLKRVPEVAKMPEVSAMHTDIAIRLVDDF